VPMKLAVAFVPVLPIKLQLAEIFCHKGAVAVPMFINI